MFKMHKKVTLQVSLMAAIVALSFFPEKAFGKVRAYPAPSTESLSVDFVVKADRTDVPVYLAKIAAMDVEQRTKVKVGHRKDSSTYTNIDSTSFASFDFQGKAKVVVTCPKPVQSVKLMPLSRGIKPVVSGNKITFTISKPGQLVLEVNGDWVHSLQLFANPWETNMPDPENPDVIYYGPGRHEISDVKVTSGKTVYIAGGAVLYGKATPGSGARAIFNLDGDNITVRGRGIVDGSLCPQYSRRILVGTGKNIRIEGIVLRDAGSWSLVLSRTENAQIQNVKIFGYRDNSDGIDLCNSRNIEVSDCFLRTFDDLVVVKTPEKEGVSNDIIVRRCVLWNEFAHALSLGAELRTDIDKVRFTDCDIIHDKGREYLLRVYNCDSARVTNIAFDNIRIEEAQMLASLWIGPAIWSKESARGQIEGVSFRHIQTVAPIRRGAWPVNLVGFDADHAIRGVQFDEMQIDGQTLKLSDVKQNDFVSGVEIRP